MKAVRREQAAFSAELNERGFALLDQLLAPEECDELTEAFEQDALFRSRIDMSRYNFGSGEYRYFAYPLPERIAQLRSRLYSQLVATANDWRQALARPGQDAADFPAKHESYLASCHAAGQTRPTPLLLRYRAGDYNRLHQDLYGAHVFPIQVAILLSEPGRDFQGGEFVLTRQRPRMQSQADVVPLRRGQGVAFAVNQFPVPGRRGLSRAVMRHGVSRVHAGERHVLGMIFHDAAG